MTAVDQEQTEAMHAGRTVVVVETDMTDADRRRVAKVLQTQAVLREG
jgi:acyl-coenzyme A thioesterase PaaI-like protein